MLTYCPTIGAPRRNIDQLFISLAGHHGPRTIGVVLSGQLDDGTRGLVAIKKAGGVAMVQSSGEAAYRDMPRNAIKSDGQVDLVASIADPHRNCSTDRYDSHQAAGVASVDVPHGRGS
jgi:chemotaxis response regulator CheB